MQSMGLKEAILSFALAPALSAIPLTIPPFQLVAFANSFRKSGCVHPLSPMFCIFLSIPTTLLNTFW